MTIPSSPEENTLFNRFLQTGYCGTGTGISPREANRICYFSGPGTGTGTGNQGPVREGRVRPTFPCVEKKQFLCSLPQLLLNLNVKLPVSQIQIKILIGSVFSGPRDPNQGSVIQRQMESQIPGTARF